MATRQLASANDVRAKLLLLTSVPRNRSTLVHFLHFDGFFFVQIQNKKKKIASSITVPGTHYDVWKGVLPFSVFYAIRRFGVYFGGKHRKIHRLNGINIEWYCRWITWTKSHKTIGCLLVSFANVFNYQKIRVNEPKPREIYTISMWFFLSSESFTCLSAASVLVIVYLLP